MKNANTPTLINSPQWIRARATVCTLAVLAIPSIPTAVGQAVVSSTFVEGPTATTTQSATFNGSYTLPETFSNFKSTVASAATAGFGGVFTFDITGDIVSNGGFFGTYATNKTITVANSGINQGQYADWSIGNNTDNRQATSSNSYLSRTGNSAQLMQFSLSGSGLGTGECINKIGFVVLSRDSNTYESAVRVRYSNGTVINYGTDLLSSATVPNAPNGVSGINATFNANIQLINSGKGANNMFFLFEAPTGLGITNVEFLATTDAATPGSWFSGIDNVSFTTTVIPEPSVAALLGLGLVVLAVARRRIFRRQIQ